MSRQPIAAEVEYPESDGQPMGETEWHVQRIVRLWDQLRFRYRDQAAYVSNNLLLYYEEGNRDDCVVPDIFVALNCHSGARRTFKTWEEHKVPEFVLEVVSESTYKIDLSEKLQTYGRIGIHEVFLFDPLGDCLQPPLRGFRAAEDFHMIPIEPSSTGTLMSETLGLTLCVDGLSLELIDTTTGHRLVTEAVAETLRADTERAARLEAESRLAKLEEELRRHQGHR